MLTEYKNLTRTMNILDMTEGKHNKNIIKHAIWKEHKNEAKDFNKAKS